MVLDTAGASALISTIDLHVLLGLAIAAAVTLLAAFVPASGANFWLGLISLLGAVIYHWRAFPGFVIVSGVSYLAVRWLNTHTERSRRWNLACALLALLVIIFGLGRLWHWDAVSISVHSTSVLIFSLDMWLLLRLVTMFWEVGSGTIPAPSPSRFLLWVCLPFTIGGPLMRLSEMPGKVQPQRHLLTSGRWWRALIPGAAMLLGGIGLGFVEAAMEAHWQQHHFLKNAIETFFTAPFAFYWSSAGYFGLMAALALPSGFKIQPSFNLPFGRENISAFWMNWNMTATFVFRDYLFYNRWGRKNYNVYFNTIFLFTLVGFWHALNAYWILWGFLHGLLFCTYLLWRKYGQRWNLPFRGTATGKLAARMLTYFSICMCWYLPSKILQKLHGFAF